jgi:hypothetical protein
MLLRPHDPACIIVGDDDDHDQRHGHDNTAFGGRVDG